MNLNDITNIQTALDILSPTLDASIEELLDALLNATLISEEEHTELYISMLYE